MFKRSISGWLVAIVFLGVLVGIMGGGVMGGVVGYYVALNHAPVIEPSAPGQLTVAQAPSKIASVVCGEGACSSIAALLHGFGKKT